MTGKKTDSSNLNTSSGSRQWLRYVVLGVACALVIGVFAWSAEPGFLETVSPNAGDSYYNLLTQGFQAGQLNVKREAPVGLAKLADPYNPSFNEPFLWDEKDLCYEMSYYKGKLYLYFGVTPVLVLFWPYAALTGHYFRQEDAVVIFFSFGFLAGAYLLYAAWRRYFSETAIWVVAVGLLMIGFATGILEMLSSCDVYEIAISCGFAFAMLALAAIWQAIHDREGRSKWLLLASMSYGLAVGARPSLLFGGIILLMPLVHSWFAGKPVSRQQFVWWLVAAIVPITLIGLGLMSYNIFRFGNPFEFGWHYQLTNYNNWTAQQFSLHYLYADFRFYFLEPIGWSDHFPFLQMRTPPPGPAGFYGAGLSCSGILINYPVVWLALAIPLAGKRGSREKFSGLTWFAATAFLLFAVCAVTLCLFFACRTDYELDFLPALVLLAAIGIFAWERALADSPVRLRIARSIWCLLAGYAIIFNILAGVECHATNSYFDGNSFVHQGRLEEAIKCFQTSLKYEPDSAPCHLALGTAYYQAGSFEEGLDECKKALELNPKFAEAEFDLGYALLQMGQMNEGFLHLEKAMALDPHFAETHFATENNNLAWSLATNPDPDKRNGPLAVALAKGACQNTHYQTTMMVGTLAAAYAEAGRFDEAIATAQKACTLASKSGDEKLLESNQKLMSLYLKHQPYRDYETNPGK